MRDVNYTNALQSVRSIGGRVTVRDKRLRFTRFPATETTFDAYDSDLYDGEILRVGVVGTDAYFSSIHPDDEDFEAPTWSSAGITVKASSRIGLYANRLFYQGSDNGLYYADFDGSAFGSPTSIASYAHADFSDGIAALAPVSDTEVYVLTIKNGATYQYGIINLLTTAGANVQWHGTIYEDTGNDTPFLDAVRVSGTDYVYYTASNNLRTRFVKKSGNFWSDVENVIPIDLVDDDSLFRMHSVTTINSSVMMVGTLKRKYGLSMLIYTFGPEEFTLGRDVFIRPEDTDEIGGKFFLFDDVLWCVGNSIRHSAPATYLVGYDNTSLKYTSSNFFEAQISQSADGSGTLGMQFPSSETHAALIPGSELIFEAKVGDQYSKLGTFVIETIEKSHDDAGSVKQVTARSKAQKTLAQWESDAAYDYWSQTKVNTNISELTKLVRATGSWTEHEEPESPTAGEPPFEGLTLDNYNVGGYLYSVDNPTVNGQAVGEFAVLSDSNYARPVFGVGLGYYRESRYEAAERLDQESIDLDTTDFGQNGIMGLYTSGTVGTGANPHFYIALLKDNAITSLASSSEITLTPDVKYHIMLKLHEGKAYLYYRAYESTKLWTLALSADIRNAGYDAIPWRNNGEGRAFVYMLNSTPYAEGGPIDSDDLFIPVADNGDFPATGTVVIDDEHIEYTSKSENRAVSDLSYTYGDVLSSVEDTVTGWTEVGKDRNATFLRQIFTVSGTWYVKAISLYVKKVGSPSDGLMVWWGKSTMNVPTKVTDMLSEQMTVKSEDITTEGGWVTIVFPKVVPVTNGCMLIMTRGYSATHPSAVDGTNNHFLISMTGNTHGSGNSDLWKWNEDTDLWSRCGGAANDMRFYVYGASSNPGEGFYQVGLAYDADLSTSDDYYNNCALVVTEGSGEGTSMLIYDYEYTPAKTAWLMVDRNTDTFDETTKFKIVPTLLGLTRGADDTDATAHLEGTVSLIHDGYFSSIGDFLFLSGNKDLSAADLINKLCRKAGAELYSALSLSSFTPSSFSTPLTRKNLVFDFTVSETISGTVVFKFLDALSLEIGADYLKFYDGTDTLQDHFSLGENIYGKVTVSHWDGFISVWINDRFIHGWSFALSDAYGDEFDISGTSTQTFSMELHEASMRIDNHIMDNYRKGADLLSSIIGEKRIRFHDDLDGKLKIFTERTTVNTSGTPYVLAVGADEVQTDVGLFTRVLLEGAEVHERFDTTALVQHGNIFHGSGMNEIYSQYDAEYYTEKLLGDLAAVYEPKTLMGAADPRIEPNDILYVTFPSGVKKIIVDQIGFQLGVSETSAVFDMNINGRLDGTS